MKYGKIPEHAKKVFSGVMFDIFQWDQELYDGSTELYERAVRTGNSQIVATLGEKIIGCEQMQAGRDIKYLGLPGGRIEKGEAPLDASKRELLEETGLQSDDWELWLEHEGFWRVHVPRFVFIARDCKKVAEQQLDPGESIEIREFTFDEFIDLSKEDEYWVDFLKLRLMDAYYNPRVKEELRKKLWPSQ